MKRPAFLSRLKFWRRTAPVDLSAAAGQPADNLHQVLSAELAYIRAHRHPEQADNITQRSLVGLALSGGGIRSATTNLGILQALSRMEVLPLVDYLCTVSGGGYIGSCLSALTSWNGDPPTQEQDPCARYVFANGQTPFFNTYWPRFPFRTEVRDNWSRVGREIVAHLRTHGNFLIAHLGVLTRQTMRAMGSFLTGIVLNVGAFLLIVFTVSAIYLAAVTRVAPALPAILGDSTATGVVLDSMRNGLVDVDSSIVRVHSSTCPGGASACEIETRTTRRDLPSLGRRVSHNVGLMGTTLRTFLTQGVTTRDHGQRVLLSLWSNGRFYPLAAPVFFGVLYTVIVLLWMIFDLRHYLEGEGARVPHIKRGESVEDAFERTKLRRLALVAAIVSFACVAVPFLFNGDRLRGRDQILWLFVPLTFIATARLISLIIALVVLPWPALRPYVFSRRMRSLWSAFQAITIYGWWLLLVIAVLPAIIYALRDQSIRVGFSAVVALLLTRLATTKSAGSTKWWRILAGRFRNVVLGALVMLVVAFVFLFFATLLTLTSPIWVLKAAGIGLAVVMIVGRTLDTNKLGPHYFYRDRLAETYLLTEVPTTTGRLSTYHDAMELPLHCVHGVPAPGNGTFQNSAPYLLISAAINMAGSRDLTRKDRKSGYWLFSKLYCGSIHTGFRPTESYRKGETKLSRALAISGAAASSAVGRFTFFAQAFASVLFNIRLGHWLENPDKPRSLDSQEGLVFWPSYVWREVTMNTTETTDLVNLSDGGHTGDNIGIYPLLQRRCKVIIACDAECDPALTFGSLTEALRQAYIDMGIDIDIDLTMIRPDKLTGLSRSHCAVGRIHYPDRPDQASYLVYLKNSLSGDEPEPILNYKTQSLEFPHESTIDQFFDDNQFEAYRALGVHIAEDALGPWVTCDLFDMVRQYQSPTTTMRTAQTGTLPRSPAQETGA
jgi:hypothetical protein